MKLETEDISKLAFIQFDKTLAHFNCEKIPHMDNCFSMFEGYDDIQRLAYSKTNGIIYEGRWMHFKNFYRLTFEPEITIPYLFMQGNRMGYSLANANSVAINRIYPIEIKNEEMKIGTDGYFITLTPKREVPSFQHVNEFFNKLDFTEINNLIKHGERLEGEIKRFLNRHTLLFEKLGNKYLNKEDENLLRFKNVYVEFKMKQFYYPVLAMQLHHNKIEEFNKLLQDLLNIWRMINDKCGLNNLFINLNTPDVIKWDLRHNHMHLLIVKTRWRDLCNAENMKIRNWRDVSGLRRDEDRKFISSKKLLKYVGPINKYSYDELSDTISAQAMTVDLADFFDDCMVNYNFTTVNNELYLMNWSKLTKDEHSMNKLNKAFNDELNIRRLYDESDKLSEYLENVTPEESNFILYNDIPEEEFIISTDF